MITFMCKNSYHLLKHRGQNNVIINTYTHWTCDLTRTTTHTTLVFVNYVYSILGRQLEIVDFLLACVMCTSINYNGN